MLYFVTVCESCSNILVFFSNTLYLLMTAWTERGKSVSYIYCTDIIRSCSGVKDSGCSKVLSKFNIRFKYIHWKSSKGCGIYTCTLSTAVVCENIRSWAHQIKQLAVLIVSLVLLNCWGTEQQDDVIKSASQISNHGKPCGKPNGNVSFMFVSWINLRNVTVSSLVHANLMFLSLRWKLELCHMFYVWHHLFA